MKTFLIAFSIIFTIFVASLFPFGFGVSYSQIHSSPQLNTKTQDINFHWEKTLAQGDWDRISLWDWETFGHCFLSFHYSFDTSMDVPATLSATCPSFLEPNQTFLIETKLESTGDRIIELKPAIYFGIDLYIPLVTSFQATYGGQWTMTFNLNTKSVQQMLDKVWIGDFTYGQLLSIAKDAINLNSYVTFQQLEINNGSLGTLVLGQMKLDLLRAVLYAVLHLISVPPPLVTFVTKLDWLLSKFFKVSTGLLITPSISAYVSCPVTSNSRFANLGTDLIRFENDLTPKNIQLTSASDSEEKNGANEFTVGFSPISFSYQFDVGWQYYFDIDVGLLGRSLWQHTWTFDIYRGPCINWDSQPISASLEIVSRIDEPLQATETSFNDGKIAVDLFDKSGVSEAILYYSLDKVNWNSKTLTLETGTSYSERPISDVSEDTVVFYYVKALDGQGNPYYIGTASSCYNFTLRASFLSAIQSPRNLAIISVVVVLVAIVTGTFALRRRGKKRMQLSEGS